MNTLYSKENPSSIRKMFNSIASRYDMANWAMSLGLHVLWNRTLAKKALFQLPISRSNTILDMCCGTGEITFRLRSLLEREMLRTKTPPPQQIVFGIDFSEAMLDIARKRLGKMHNSPDIAVSFCHGDATALPFSSNSFDRITMAYGIRNIHMRETALQEMARVLKDDGIACLIELTRPTAKIIEAGHRIYLKTIVPLIGRVVARDKESYAYLSKSIHHFIPKDQLCQEILKSGFHSVEAIPLSFGAATIFIARKS